MILLVILHLFDFIVFFVGVAMNVAVIQVLCLLLGAVLLFATNRLRMDVTALLLIVAFAMSGLLTLPEVLAGFSDANVILIALLFVVGEGLIRTGVAYRVGDWILQVAGNSETRLLALLMLAVALLGSVMSSTGVVAIFIPVALSIANRMGLAPARVMMPLSLAGLVSGMLTLVATPPNLVVSSELERQGFAGMSFFALTPVGVLILLLGIGYMRLVGPRLLAKVPAKNYDKRGRRHMQELVTRYQLAERACRLQIQPGSVLIGPTLEELQLRARFGANVLGIERRRGFHHLLVGVTTQTRFEAHDVLLVDLVGAPAELSSFCRDAALTPMPLRGEYFSEHARSVGLAEVSLIPGSRLLGKTLRQLAFRREYRLSVVGIERAGQAVTEQLLDEPLQLADTLLVAGEWKQIRYLQQHKRDFLLFDLPVEVEEMSPARNQAPLALLCVALMVGLMLSGLVPNVVAALIACLLLGAFRCVDMESAYRSIQWPTLLLIIGMMPFATALQKSGALDMVVEAMVALFANLSPRLMLGVLFAVAAVIGLFISNTATALLLAPVAIGVASRLGLSPYPFAITVAIASSAAFMTPVSSPVNTLVLVPGGYRFGDFVRLGVPFTLIVMLTTVLVVPLLFNF